MGCFILCDLRNLVQKDNVAEFYLFDYQILYVFFFDSLFVEVLSAPEFTFHA